VGSIQGWFGKVVGFGLVVGLVVGLWRISVEIIDGLMVGTDVGTSELVGGPERTIES